MPITMEMLRNGHVLLRTLTDPLDASDLLNSFYFGRREILGRSTHIVHLIFDATNLHKFPNNLLSFWRSAEKTAVAQTGHIIIVSESNFLKMMTELVSHVTHLDPITAPTLDEALRLVDRWLEEEPEQNTAAQHKAELSDR